MGIWYTENSAEEKTTQKTSIIMKSTPDTMKDRIALVTGGSRGLGRDIALRLADVVGSVAISCRKKRNAAEKMCEEIRTKGKIFKVFPTDLTAEKQVQKLVSGVEEEFGRIDILVNNAGPILVKPWEKVTSKEWEDTLRSNLNSALWAIKSALPGMKKRKWGRIINIGYSRAEQLAAFPTILPYAVAKTGLLLVTRTVASAVASEGITVNMVSPGLMEGSVLPESRNVPQGRLGTFQDVSNAILFLVSDEASYITGANLVVAGGWKT